MTPPLPAGMLISQTPPGKTVVYGFGNSCR